MWVRFRAAMVVIAAATAAFPGCDSAEPTTPEPVCPPSCPPPPLEGAWSNGASLQVPRRELPAALLDGRIHVAGGFGDDRQVLTTMEAYDPQLDRWSTAPSMPGPRHHHGAVVANGRLYVIGGYSTLGTTWAVESTMFEFDPATGSWSDREPLPQPRGAMAAASLDGRIYVFGGAASGTERNDTWIYDPAADAWSAGAPMPTAREHVAAASVASTIYVAGGRTFSGINTRALEAYSPETNTWRTLAPMKAARSGHGMGVMGGKLYVFGGESLQSGGVLRTVEEYDPETDAWRQVAPLPVAVTGPGVVGAGGAIHVIGGSDGDGLTRRAHMVFTLP